MLNILLNGTEKLRMEVHEKENTVMFMTAASLASRKCSLSIIPNNEDPGLCSSSG